MISPADESEIRRLIARNAHMIDNRDVDGTVAQYAEDARFIVKGEEIRGQAAIRAFFSGRERPFPYRHMVMSPELKVESANRVISLTDFTVVGKPPGVTGYAVTSAGRYEDIIERQDDKSWRFHTRNIVSL